MSLQNLYRQTLTFTRTEGVRVTTIAIVIVYTKVEIPNKDILMERMEAACTAWFRNTEEGQQAWIDCDEDFNIGDLARMYASDGDAWGEDDPDSLADYMRAHGIAHMDIQVADSHDAFDFDHVIGQGPTVDEIEAASA